MSNTRDRTPNEPVLLEHGFDGIREYDNPLPGWWRWTFYGTIVFSVVYWIWFHAGGPGPSEHEEYAAARKVYEADRARERSSGGGVNEPTLRARSRDPSAVTRGKAVFSQFCASCHTDDGRGLVGPNLTDEFQKHGRTRVDLLQTVSQGVTGTAMVAWAETLSPDKLLDVVVFVATLRGTNLAGGKAPEGDRVGPFEP